MKLEDINKKINIHPITLKFSGEQKIGKKKGLDLVISKKNPSSVPNSVQGLIKNWNNDQSLNQPLVDTINSVEIISNISPHFVRNKIINLCQDRYGSYAFFKTHANHLIVAMGLAIAVFALSIVTIQRENQSLESSIIQIESKMTQIYRDVFPSSKKIQEPYLELKAHVLNLQKKSAINSNNNNYSYRSKAIDIILELSNRIPVSINLEISRIIVNNDRIVLSGSTDNFRDVETIKNTLKNHELFKVVSIGNAVMSKAGRRVDFKYVIEI